MIQEIDLTQEIIDTSERGCPFQCAVAMAVTNQLNEPCEVDDGYIMVTTKNSLDDYETNEHLEDYIKCFDRDRGIKPETICLDKNTMTAYIKPRGETLCKSI